MNGWRNEVGECGAARRDLTDEVLIEHRAVLVRYVLKLSRDEHVAEDVAQEAILRALEGRGCPDDAERALRWLKRTAYHLWVDVLRRRSHRESLSEGDEWIVAETGVAADEREVQLGETTVDWEWLQQELPRAIHGVPNSYRDLIRRRYVGGQSCRVIASAVGLTVGSVKTRLYRGRKVLRRVLRSRARSRDLYVPRAGRNSGGTRT
ncbi:MAG: RNA polymerase sigma factor [Planctomycetes bacterium]|nr:RNA polymerase sigma factor [Planctomycetota bacterium]